LPRAFRHWMRSARRSAMHSVAVGITWGEAGQSEA
jgi:hypothetical protein